MNDTLEDEDVARRYAHSNTGCRLISYHPAALRVYRLQVRVLKMLRSELPLLDEFIMKCIDAGQNTIGCISGLLGIEEQIVERTLHGLQNLGLVYLGAPSSDHSHRLLLTPKGVDVLGKRQLDHPVEDDVWAEMDGLTGAVSMVTPWRPDASSVTKDGFVVVDPLPRMTPKPEEIKRKRLIEEAWKKSDPKYRLINVIEIIKHEPCFRDDGLMLAFVADDTHSIRYELVVDGVLSQEHGQSFRKRLALKPDLRFPAFLKQEDSDLPTPDDLLDEHQTSHIRLLNQSKEQAESRAEELSGKLNEVSDAETHERMKNQIEALQAERDALADQVNKMDVRHLTVFDHPKYLQDALQNCKERLMIISPWITPAVVNNRFLNQLEAVLQRGVKVYIGYGINDDTDQRNDNDAISDLKFLTRRYKSSFHLVRLGDTHAKVLLCDNAFVITGSFNWLSFKGNPHWKPRDEQSTYIGMPEKIEDQFRFNKQRLEAAMASSS